MGCCGKVLLILKSRKLYHVFHFIQNKWSSLIFRRALSSKIWLAGVMGSVPSPSLLAKSIRLLPGDGWFGMTIRFKGWSCFPHLGMERVRLNPFNRRSISSQISFVFVKMAKFGICRLRCVTRNLIDVLPRKQSGHYYTLFKSDLKWRNSFHAWSLNARFHLLCAIMPDFLDIFCNQGSV